MATLSYANAGSGPSAGGIGWINFGAGFSLTPGTTITGLSVSLLDGSTMTFNINNTTLAGDGVTFSGSTPSYAFGNIGYTGLSSSDVVLQNPTGVPGTTSNKISLTNISITDTNGNPVPNYTIILGDGESTNTGETLIFNTNAGAFSLFTTIDPGPNGPLVAGTGTQTVTLTGTVAGIAATSNIFTTLNPTEVSCTVNSTIGGFQGFTVGVAISKITIAKDIASRYSASDQFNLTILGTPNDTATTSGSIIGAQPVTANVFGIVNNTYSINESMAAGSFGTLSNYTTTVSWSNLAADGTTVPNPGALGNNITLALGDVVTATITNAVKPVSPGRGVKFI